MPCAISAYGLYLALSKTDIAIAAGFGAITPYG